MSYKKATKKDEQELKEYTKAVAEEQPSTDTKGLQKALEKQGVDYTTFAKAEESWRKRALKEDYSALKLKHGWLYDQPIE